MHPLQVWKLSRGKVRSQARSCPPRNPSSFPALLDGPSVSQVGPGTCRLWGRTESPSRPAPACAQMWSGDSQSGEGVEPALGEGGRGARIAPVPGVSQLPYPGVPGVGYLRTVSSAGTSLLPGRLSHASWLLQVLGRIFSLSQTLTQPASNPSSHLERGMFFSLTSSFSAPPQPPKRPLPVSSLSLQLHNIPRQLGGRRQDPADSHAPGSPRRPPPPPQLESCFPLPFAHSGDSSAPR